MSLPDAVAAIFSMSTEARLEKIQSHIREKADIKTAKFEEHDGLLVDAALGDAAAKKRADQLKREMDVLDVELRDLYRALDQCTARHEAEQRARAEAEKLKQKEVARSNLDKRATSAARLDKLARQFADEMREYRDLTLDTYRALPVKDGSQHDSVLSVQTADNSIRVTLRGHGVEWATPYSVETKTSMAEQVERQNAVIRQLLDK